MREYVSPLRRLLGHELRAPTMAASGPECVKTPGQTLAMISESLIAGGTHETVYPG